MGQVVIPTSADWANVNFGDGLCLVEGRLAELVHPELWCDCGGAWSHALDYHPWDYSGHNHHGTRVTAGVTDKPDGWQFDGTTNNRINCGAVLGSGSYNRVSLEGWVFRPVSTDGAVAGIADDSGRRFNILLLSGTTYYQIGNKFNSVSNSRIGWHHYAITYDSALSSGRFKLWIDGENVASSDSFTSAYTPSGDTLSIGAEPSNNRWREGLHGATSIFTRVLSPQEIQALASRFDAAYEVRLLPRVFAVSSSGTTVAVGLTTETDSALVVTPDRTLAVGHSAEADSAQAVTVNRTLAVGQATEADTAGSVTPAKTIAVGQAVEADSALSVAHGSVASVGLANETDLSLAVTINKTVSIGLASENDTAQSATPNRKVSVGQTVEVDAGLGLGILKTVVVGMAAETNTALTVTTPLGILTPIHGVTAPARSRGIIAPARSRGIIAPAR